MKVYSSVNNMAALGMIIHCSGISVLAAMVLIAYCSALGNERQTGPRRGYSSTGSSRAALVLTPALHQ